MFNIDKFKNSRLLLIVIGYVLINIIIFILGKPWNPEIVNNRILVSDPAGYNELAFKIKQFGLFSDKYGNVFRTPLYPLILSVFYKLFGFNVIPIIVFHILLNITSLFILYYFLNKWFHSKIALIGITLYSLDIGIILFANTLYPDTIFSFVILNALLLLIHSFKTKRLNFILVSSILFGIATLIKPASQYFVLVVVVLIFVLLNSWKLRIKYSILFLLIFTFTLSPWIIRNYKMYNTTQLTSLKGDIMIYWLCTMTECSKTGKTVQTVRNEFYSEAKKNGVIDSVSSFQSSPIYTEMGKQFLKDNKIPFIKSSINGCIRLLFSPGTYFFIDHFQLKIEKTKFNTMASSNLLQSIKYYLTDKSAIEILFITLYTIFLVICYISAIKGIYVLYIQREFKVLLPIIAVIVFFIVITGIIGSARYRIPFIAFVFILSSIGISSFVQIKK